MGQLVTPTVYFIGTTAMNQEEMTRYLNDSGNQAFQESIDAARAQGLSDGEIMCSFFAKLCYASLTEGKNKNLSRIRDIPDNIRATFDQGHGCYDIDTEVLTSQGWKFWPDVTESDELATRRTADALLEYRRPTRLVSYHHRGKMYRVESHGVDLLVTPDHKMLACPTTTREGRQKTDFRLIAASDLDTRSHAYIKTAEWRGGSAELTSDVLSLLGFAIGDGNLERETSQLRFHLRRTRKIAYLRSVVYRLGWHWREDDNNDRFVVIVPAAYLGLFRGMYTNDREKQVPGSLLTDCRRDALTSLFDGLMQSDGSIGKTGDCFDTTSSRLAGQFQQLCLHLGIAANIVYTYDAEERPTSFGDRPLTRLSVLRRNLKPEVNAYGRVSGRAYWIDGWEGDVFCAEVPNNTLYVRRNGVPVWSGNSVFEHVQLNFVIRNCSRVFTHELVRHRAGTAFSQTSGRFVRGDALDVISDPILAAHGILSVEEARSIQIFLEERMLEMGRRIEASSASFDLKKKLTSAVRRWLPNGQANEMGFSVNIRALRHIIMLRTNASAEWEIRNVFAQVYKLTRDRFPLLYYRAKTREVNGITEVYGMKLQPHEKIEEA